MTHEELMRCIHDQIAKGAVDASKILAPVQLVALRGVGLTIVPAWIVERFLEVLAKPSTQKGDGGA